MSWSLLADNALAVWGLMTVLWLVSDGAAHVNGQVITVDGGWSVSG